jgi:hypothetical protein
MSKRQIEDDFARLFRERVGKASADLWELYQIADLDNQAVGGLSPRRNFPTSQAC